MKMQKGTEGKIKAVIFDIDGTLSPDISWTKLTLLLGASVPDHLSMYEKFKNGTMEYDEAKKILLSLWTASGPLTKTKLQAIFDKWAIKDEAIPIFRYLKEKGYVTCLITGSVDLFAKTIAARVGADSWYANTDLIWDTSDNLVDLNYELKASEKKLRQLKEFCASRSLQPDECVVVGDDENDIGLFQATGKGIAVESPTSKVLKAYAWQEINSLADLKDIL